MFEFLESEIFNVQYIILCSEKWRVTVCPNNIVLARLFVIIKSMKVEEAV